MKKFSKIVLLTLTVSLVICLSVVPGIRLNTQAAPNVDGDWLQGWTYRKAHFISATNSLSGYQVRIKVYKGTGTDSGNTVYCNHLCQNDFDDIRFTWSMDSTTLDYWRESYSYANYAYFWVKIPSISSIYGCTIYMYYGNSTVSSESNPDDTFLFFDSFDGSSLDSSKWQYQTGDQDDIYVNGGFLTIYSATTTSNRVMYNAKAQYEVLYDVALTVRSRASHSDARWCPMVHLRQRGATYNYEAGRLYTNTNHLGYLRASDDGSSTTTSISSLDFTSWHHRTLSWEYGELKYHQDGSYKTHVTSNVPNEKLVPGLWAGNTLGRTEYVQWDWVLLRKYDSNEPTHVSWAPQMTYQGKDNPASPYKWHQYWIRSTSQDEYLLKGYVVFDSTAINHWRAVDVWPYYWKYTLDFHEITSEFKTSSNDWWASNLPGAYFDKDESSSEREVEIVARLTASLQAEQTYSAFFGMNTHSTGWAKFEHSSQASVWNIPPEYPPEWQTVPGTSDVLQRFYGYIFDIVSRQSTIYNPGTMYEHSSTSCTKTTVSTDDSYAFVSSLSSQCQFAVFDKGSGNYKIKIYPMVHDENDFNQYKSWNSDQTTSLLMESPDNEIPVVLTLTHPISIMDLEALANEYDFKVNSFEIKVLTSQGEEWTIGGRPEDSDLLPQEKFDTMLKSIEEATGDDNLQVQGFYALWGTVKPSSLASLQECNSVGLVDISPALVIAEVQQLGFTGTLMFTIPDLYEESIR